MTLIQIISILLPIVVSIIGYLYKNGIDRRFVKIEKKSELLSIDNLKEVEARVNKHSDSIISITKDVDRTKDDIKAIETIMDRKNCPGIEECKKTFVGKDSMLTKEVLEEVLSKKFAEFELKLIKEGRIPVITNNKV